MVAESKFDGDPCLDRRGPLEAGSKSRSRCKSFKLVRRIRKHQTYQTLELANAINSETELRRDRGGATGEILRSRLTSARQQLGKISSKPELRWSRSTCAIFLQHLHTLKRLQPPSAVKSGLTAHEMVGLAFSSRESIRISVAPCIFCTGLPFGLRVFQ